MENFNICAGTARVQERIWNSVKAINYFYKRKPQSQELHWILSTPMEFQLFFIAILMIHNQGYQNIFRPNYIN